MIQMPPTQTSYFPFNGGLDLVTPPLSIPNGKMRFCNNLEIAAYNAYVLFLSVHPTYAKNVTHRRRLLIVELAKSMLPIIPIFDKSRDKHTHNKPIGITTRNNKSLRITTQAMSH